MNETSDHTTNDTISTYSITAISVAINRSVLLMYIIFGLIGNIFNIFLFTSPILMRTSSSIYLLSTSIANLLVVILVIPFRFFADGFDLDLTSYSLLSCRLVSYIYYVCLALPPFFTVLGCADRWAASCREVNRRRFASIHIAKRVIPFVIILCCLLYSHILLTYTVDIKPPPPFCSVDRFYAIFGLTYQLIIYSLIPPLLMGTFSICIIYNVRRKRKRIMPVVHIANTSTNDGMIRQNRRRLSQMQVMLVCQAIIECIMTLPFSVINLVSIVVDNSEYFLAIYTCVRLFIFFNYVSSFYVYTLSSKLYRNEFKKLVTRIFRRD